MSQLDTNAPPASAHANAKPRITILIPCYNERENVRDLALAIDRVFQQEPGYDHTLLFIDNASTDGTRSVLREMAHESPRIRVILNARNFGHIRSPFHALLQVDSDCCLTMACDFQDPPEMIPRFLREWESGYKTIVGVKTASKESRIMYALRSLYYGLLGRISQVELMQHVTGFGLYDRQVLQILREIQDPYPYFRGLLAEIGLKIKKLEFTQPRRSRGLTKNNFFTLYDMAMLGVVNHSRIPLRFATLCGFLFSACSFAIAFAYLAAKLMFWDAFSLGTAPILIGIFFLGSVQLFFVGIIGEYVGAILTQVQKRPLVIEEERLNFASPGEKHTR